MIKYAFIGGGNMAKALIKGIITQLPANQILATTRTKESSVSLTQEYGINSSTNNADVKKADIIILAVKPQIVFEVLEALPNEIFKDKLVISVIAGVNVSKLKSALPPTSRLIRSMPNTPAFIGAGVTGLYADTNATDSDKNQTDNLFKNVGRTLWVEQESGIDFINAISGSGPAYFFEFIKAVAESGERLGLTKSDSVMLAIQTAKGSALLAEHYDRDDLQSLIDQVTSKGGTTIEAIKAFRAQKLDDIVDDAIQACYKRIREISDK